MIPDANSLPSEWASQLRRGVLELAVLAALADKPQHGYELVTAFRASNGLEVSEGTLYPLLRRLEKQGALAASWQPSPTGPPRKVFGLSVLGQAVLLQMQQEWQQLSQTIGTLLGALEPKHAEHTSSSPQISPAAAPKGVLHD
jgi:PadR family transcriptional regulator, regulatory protein PadR